ncbi:hypothetical protein ABGB18_02295 [Nonomuraea sp. B12E4]|uniref:hypothetical protein n=1 Tax=Nonomuraea sp. B12E4 TaxID=3153564 RepID=UPI00325CAF7E
MEPVLRSPFTSMATTLREPTTVRMVTRPGWSGTTVLYRSTPTSGVPEVGV